ncbi:MULTISPECIES: cytochrome c oxidase subunit II [unclassified Shinella]|uniref:cytochrome c oxidase subunit II n=1 Tax=unclassified Shinella TaxID=2643062 RepID=UPI00225DB401|nr:MULTISPECIES: cytochrome c oxidase subunit II [unclassified Shinella]MCO5136449.1 cytochrome c oxidase subunit II [Shinella sp.]CAI0336525.1 Cytochrome c oxidase polypeptide II [Rhizobiaceae bacterium]
MPARRCGPYRPSGTTARSTAIHRRALPLLLIPLSGCSGIQSALDPAGDEAAAIYTLFLVMVAGGALIWLAVVGLLLHAARRRGAPWSEKTAGRLIAWGGVAFPVAVLLALLAYAVWLMPAIRPWLAHSAPADRPIEVTGEQFWWRIRYPAAEGMPAFETANELRLPVGARAVFALKAQDVIHSFWIPALGGKMDMIPGRTNTLSLLPTRAGVFRAPCAEFCGASHTLMAFSVVVMELEDYAAWRRAQADGNFATGSEGERLFARHGCAGCHGIRGLTETASLGPDLTFFGQRQTVGAGTLANTAENVARFIRNPDKVKPGAKMPAFDMLPDGDIAAMADYLVGLR